MFSHKLREQKLAKVKYLDFRRVVETFHRRGEVFDEFLEGAAPEIRKAYLRAFRGSSRSVAANIAEGFRKRQYPSMFVSKLADSDAEATETQVWLDFARDCGYLSTKHHKELVARYEEIGMMLHSIIEHPDRFAPSSQVAR